MCMCERFLSPLIIKILAERMPQDETRATNTLLFAERAIAIIVPSETSGRSFALRNLPTFV